MFSVSFIPAFKDNYIWLLVGQDRRAAVVDPGAAEPVEARLAEDGLTLECILVTHHHADHQGGVQALAEHWQATVHAPANESITGCTHPLVGGERIRVLDEMIDVLAVPGHTRGHLAYRAPGMLFCGDTLFGAGCGRLFEGTPGQMLDSLGRIAALPDETLLYCAHEYTAMNLPFAANVEPDNEQIRSRILQVEALRARGAPTVPLRLGEEKATNPFLRSGSAGVIRSALAKGAIDTSPLAVFTTLREWRNNF